MKSNSEQLGFGFDAMAEEQATAHLPSEMEAGIVAYRAMLEQHNRAMLDGDETRVMAIRKEANRLAVKLNVGENGDSGWARRAGIRPDGFHRSTDGHRASVGPTRRIRDQGR